MRSVHPAEVLDLAIENRRTVWYQIQEMLRSERITEPASVAHEVATYNELLGGPTSLAPRCAP
jgi:Protein of unknown function (DUF3501)